MRWRRRSPSCEEEAVTVSIPLLPHASTSSARLTPWGEVRRTLDESISEAQRKRLAFPRRTAVTQQSAQPMVVAGARHVNGAAHRPRSNQLTTRERLLDASARHTRAAHSNRPGDRARLLTLQCRQILNGVQRGTRRGRRDESLGDDSPQAHPTGCLHQKSRDSGSSTPRIAS